MGPSNHTRAAAAYPLPSPQPYHTNLRQASHERGLQAPGLGILRTQPLHLRHLLQAAKSRPSRSSQQPWAAAAAAAVSSSSSGGSHKQQLRRQSHAADAPPAARACRTRHTAACAAPTCSGTDELSTSPITALSSELLAKVATERPPWPSNTPKAEKGTEPARMQRRGGIHSQTSASCAESAPWCVPHRLPLPQRHLPLPFNST